VPGITGYLIPIIKERPMLPRAGAVDIAYIHVEAPMRQVWELSTDKGY
jgi:hypothetical protein